MKNKSILSLGIILTVIGFLILLSDVLSYFFKVTFFSKGFTTILGIVLILTGVVLISKIKCNP